MPRRSLVLFLVILVASAMGFSRAFSAEKYQKEMDTLRKIMNTVQDHYVDEKKADPEKLFEGAYRGMLQGLDPYTQYFDQKENTSFSQDTEGEFGGLGIEISLRDGILTVVTPIRGTPAYEGGVLPGDLILKIDGKSTERIALEDAVRMLRGPVGSKVTLTVRHLGAAADVDISLTRAVIKPAAVESRMIDKPNGIAYMRISSFTAKVMDDFNASIKELGGPDAIKGLILDVRQNPGGLLDKAVELADQFIADGPIVSVKGRHHQFDKVFPAHKGQPFETLPVILLIDEGSASASEILAGAIRDTHRGLLVGARSYGKGSVQNVIPLGDGEALKITTAKYYTPNDKPIEDHQGIIPDIYIPMTRDYLVALRAQEREDKLRGKDALGGLVEEDDATMILPKPNGNGATAPVPAPKPEETDKDKDAPGADRRGRVVDLQLKSALNIMRWQLKDTAQAK